jgi:hypothetical protein
VSRSTEWMYCKPIGDTFPVMVGWCWCWYIKCGEET